MVVGVIVLGVLTSIAFLFQKYERVFFVILACLTFLFVAYIVGEWTIQWWEYWFQ